MLLKLENKVEASEALQRVARLFKILTLVRSQTRGRPLGRRELAEACACDKRTIQRDLQLLQEAGISLEYDVRCRSYSCPRKAGSSRLPPSPRKTRSPSPWRAPY